MHSSKLVTFAVYENLHEARLVKKKLEDAGIPAYLGGEALALVGHKPGLTSLKLEVAEEDLEHARLVLEAPSPQLPTLPVEHPQEFREDGLVSIMIFYDAVEADHAAQLLRAHRIPCELRNKPSGFVSILSPGLVNIVLVVEEQEVERACEILGFTHDAEEPDEEVPQPATRPARHAIRSETQPPVSEPRHIKRQSQTVKPASEESPVEPISTPPREMSQLVEPAPEDEGAKRGWADPVLLLVVLMFLLILALIRLKL